MRNVRRGVFETNSSSSHSVSISCKGSIEPNEMDVDWEDDKIHVTLGEFGWEWKSYSSQRDKLAYLVTMLVHLNDMYIWCEHDVNTIREQLDKLMETDGFKELSEAIASYANCAGVYVDTSEGYIDHQSYEGYKTLQDFIDESGAESIVDFVFNPGVTVNTGNDNDCPPDAWW